MVKSLQKIVFLLLMVCIGVPNVVLGQSKKCSPSLLSALSSRQNNSLLIVLKLTKQPDLKLLRTELESRRLTRKEGAKKLLTYLSKAQKDLQEPFVKKLKNQFPNVKVKHAFWFGNVLLLEIRKKNIVKLMQWDEVAWMELESEQKAYLHEATKWHNKKGSTVSVNGAERGLKEVKAHRLWRRGYTGKGQKVLNFDTGVWPDHPSFRDQFMGNYVPLNQAWKQFDSFLPTDKRGSHGTHTNGTCIGLDPLQNDTIGAGFNAYFMATDPIVSFASDIKPLAEIAMGYEWAMNPDGDLNTVDDIPDVINNSWGHTFDPQNDSAACNGFFADLLEAVELAGIVSIHSAGNEGPSLNTVGAPGTGNMSLVNVFSVGAIDGNNSAWPIANFSSRGPSRCSSGGTDPISIKPEIVAPGVAVRSAIRNNDNSFEYDLFQGTSMSAPHVSGVALLLMEAFPQATAEEIKMAMYMSAIDLGAAGEDNNYGRGMLDAEAAFQYLSNTYTPSLPQTVGLDLSIAKTSLDEIDITFEKQFIPKIYFKNSAPVPKGAIQITYGFVGESLSYKSFSSGMLLENDSILLDTIETISGWKEFFAKVEYTGAMHEVDPINNSRYTRFKLLSHLNLPWVEDFESEDPYLSSMAVINHDERYTFSSYEQNGVALMGEKCAYIRNKKYDHGSGSGARDELVSPRIHVANTDTLLFMYDWAYKKGLPSRFDSITVLMSSTGDLHFDTVVLAKNFYDDSRVGVFSADVFYPQGSGDWFTDSLFIKVPNGVEDVVLKVRATNGRGNNIFYDNFRLIDIDHPGGGIGGGVGISAINVEEEHWVVFPNPTTDYVTLVGEKALEKVTIYDFNGRKVLQKGLATDEQSIDVSSLAKGVYYIQLTSGKVQETKKLIKH